MKVKKFIKTKFHNAYINNIKTIIKNGILLLQNILLKNSKM